ncbi:MAG: DsbA family oxidoreductase [Acidimicrobiia bacterium]|mgnify:CR=1 FL=1|nr:DsbA family oxidoreductase [Acidimicrobiia bacterium]
MNVDIWSDIACPFCYVGKKQFDLALHQFEHRDQVNVRYHSFQLDPDAQIDNEISAYEMLSEKFGKTQEEMRESNSRTFSDVKQYDIELNFDDMKLTNTFDAHRLLQYAVTKNKQSEVKEQLLKAYFTDGLNIGHQDVLIKLAHEIGLDKTEVSEMLDSSDFANDVEADKYHAAELGISGVPMFVFNMEYGISGAQGTNVILEGLNQAWENTKATSC